ncbi:MAG: hypothetical protein AAF730_06995 [Bacteroidota bacterium]
MGQQQLLLIVLGSVVVMIAVIGAFAGFTEKRAQWDDETRRLAMLELATEAQAWKARPALSGGGDNGQPADFSTLRLGHLRLAADTTLGDLQVYRAAGDLCLLFKPALNQLRIDALEADCATQAGFAITVTGTDAADLTWIDAN